MANLDGTPRDQPSFPKYGDIYEVSLDPVVGSETGKQRPAVIVSNDISNRFSQTVTLLPITSQPQKKSYPFEILIPKGAGGLTLDSRIKANQIRTVDKKRLVSFRGELPPRYYGAIETALKVHLNMGD